MYPKWIKGLLDLLGACLGLLALAPVFAVIAGMIWVSLGRPILFRQVRPGRHGRPFTCYKFRSMTNEVGPDGNLLPEARRTGRLGRWLRSTSLDELPELLNVIKGEMSIVGPRPLLMAYLPLYSRQQARRHEVKPGITGWAQVNGRNALTWPEKFALDVWYVDHLSFSLDLRIIAKTGWVVILRRGINHSPDRPMPRFTGREEMDV